MKMMYIAALLTGTALVPAQALAQQNSGPGNTPNAATQTRQMNSGQMNSGMNRVEAQIQRALQALDNNDLQAARQAVQQARRQLTQQAENRQAGAGANRMANQANAIRQPLQQAEQALAQENPQRAEEALARVERQMSAMDRQGQRGTGQTNADILVDEGNAAIRVDVPEPNVTVRQANPRVAVEQQQPEIIVHQPAPVVTVDIPQPRITVRMPQPDVNVSQSQPEVEVQQGQPQVRVSESEPQVRMRESQEQANVQVQRSGEPVVRMQRSGEEANVRYTSEEAEVRVNRAEGEPDIRMERAGNQNRRTQTDQNMAQNAGGNETDRQSTAAISERGARDDVNTAIGAGASRNVEVTVADIKDYDIVGANGNNLGDIEEVVNVNNRLYAVVTSGGFLGLGEDRAAVPLSALFVTDQETLEAANMTESRIDGMANFPADRYQALPDRHPVMLGAR